VALKKLKTISYDVIVSDYMMPEMDGIEFLSIIRKKYPYLPFIIFTGRGREEVVIKAFEKGADFYLQKGGALKPQFAELEHKILAAVNQRRTEVRLSTLDRLYTVLSATNKAIVLIRDKKELLSEICRVAVEIGGFSMAWAGLVNKKKQLIEPVAVQGHIYGFLDTITISTEDVLGKRGPTGTAFREKKYNVCNDIASDPRMKTIREEALKRGYRSLAAFPFALNTENAGVITFYADTPGFFDAQIITLLDEQSKNISFALATLEDKDQQVTVKSALRIKTDELIRLFTVLPDLFCIADIDGRFRQLNPAWEKTLGYTLKELMAQQVTDFVHPDDIPKTLAVLNKLNNEEEVLQFVNRLRCKNGSYRWIEWNIFSRDLTLYAGARDITDRKRAEDALRQMNRQLNLMGSITRHDVLNQLLALESYIELSGDVIDDKQLSLLDFIKKEGNIIRTIRHQITFTREYQDMGVKEPAWQNINDCIENAITRLPMRDVRIELDHHGLEIFADPLFRNALYNLIDNALRYGGDQMKTVRFLLQESDKDLTIICEDDGVGISAEDKGRLFTQGFGKNNGLGLFLSREILSITGITITETSMPGEGGRFEMRVPKGSYRFSGTQ
jgi:PAS domain S-box-containing protein